MTQKSRKGDFWKLKSQKLISRGSMSPNTTRETEDNAYAKFWGDKQRELWYVMVFLEWSILLSWRVMIYDFHTQTIKNSGAHQQEAAWPSCQRVGTCNPVVPGWSHALATYSICSRFSQSFVMLVVNSQVVASCQLGFLTLVCCIWIIICFQVFEWSACKLPVLSL